MIYTINLPEKNNSNSCDPQFRLDFMDCDWEQSTMM